MEAMKITKLFLIAATAILMLGSCSSTMKYTWTKDGFKGKDFDKILVVATTRDLITRAAYEGTVMQLLQKEGISAQKSIDIFPQFENAEGISEEVIAQKVREGGFDGIIVASLVDVNSQQVLESYGGTAYPYGMYGRYGYGYNRYIYRGYAYTYQQDYYREQRTYVLEARLFDAEASSPENALMWTGQTKLTDPSSFESGAKSFAKTTVRTLLKKGLVY